MDPRQDIPLGGESPLDVSVPMGLTIVGVLGSLADMWILYLYSRSDGSGPHFHKFCFTWSCTYKMS